MSLKYHLNTIPNLKSLQSIKKTPSSRRKRCYDCLFLDEFDYTCNCIYWRININIQTKKIRLKKGLIAVLNSAQLFKYCYEYVGHLVTKGNISLIPRY